MPAPPEPNYVTFVGPVALLPPPVLNGSWQVYQPLDDKPLEGKIGWQLAPGLLSAWIEVFDQRYVQGGGTSAPQRTTIGIGDSGLPPGSKGVADFPVHLGPFKIGDKSYATYLVIMTTKLHWTDQWGNEQSVAGLGPYTAFIVA